VRDVTVAFPEGPDLPSFRVLSSAAEAALKGPTNRISKIIADSVWANLPDINETLVRAIRIPGLDAAVEAARRNLDFNTSGIRAALVAAAQVTEAAQAPERLNREQVGQAQADLGGLNAAATVQLDTDAEVISDALGNRATMEDLTRSITRLIAAAEALLKQEALKQETTPKEVAAPKQERIGLAMILALLSLLVTLAGVLRDGVVDGWTPDDPPPAPPAKEVVDEQQPPSMGAIEQLVDERICEVLPEARDDMAPPAEDAPEMVPDNGGEAVPATGSCARERPR
jgi:hypothetical protein